MPKHLSPSENDYPFQAGTSLNAASINYSTLRGAAALERLKEIETLMPPTRQ